MSKECNCYMSEMGLNCERIADIVAMVLNAESDMIGASWYIHELINEGTITALEGIAVSTQIGVKVAEEHFTVEMPTFSDN